MWNSRRFWAGTALCLAVLMTAARVGQSSVVHGQDKSKAAKKSAKGGRAKPLANTKSLDVKADQIQSSFAKEAEDLAGQYFDAGHFEKAKLLLESVLAVNPEAPNVRSKLDKVNERILESNDIEVEVSPTQTWKPSGVMFVEKRPVRIKAEGTYRFEASVSGISAAGFTEKDTAQDMVTGIPCGALMGVILSEGKAGKPFFIGESLDLTPKE